MSVEITIKDYILAFCIIDHRLVAFKNNIKYMYDTANRTFSIALLKALLQRPYVKIKYFRKWYLIKYTASLSVLEASIIVYIARCGEALTLSVNEHLSLKLQTCSKNVYGYGMFKHEIAPRCT